MALASSEYFPWKNCAHCDGISFRTERDFVSHLRERHCLVEGGSFVCRYGDNGVCCSLPVVGVSADDYEQHVAMQHVTRPRLARDSRGVCCHLSAVGIGARPHNEGDSHRMTRSPLDRAGQDASDGLREDGWSFYSGSQNLAAVLNDPSIGKQHYFFTREWGDKFTEVQKIRTSEHLPDISWGNCEDYIGKFEKLNQIHTKGNECNSKPSLTSDLLQHFPTLRSARSLRELVQMDMNNVPRVFFDSNFHLGKLQHFDRVFLSTRKTNSGSNTELEGQNDQDYNVVIKGSHQSVQLLQVQLSHYLDVVEVQIAKQVEQQSDAFFQSIASHEDLMEKLATTVKVVKLARKEVSKIEETFVRHSLKILRLRKMEFNYVQVLRKLKLMAILMKSPQMVDSFLSSSDYTSALELVAITKDMLHRELGLIQSIRFQGSQLYEMEQTIDKKLIAEFEEIVTEDLNNTSVNNKEINCDKYRFGQVLFGILRQKHFHCVNMFKTQAIKIVKVMVKKVEIEMIRACDTTVVGQFSLTEHLKCLPLVDWITFFKDITSKLLILIARVKDIKDVIQETIEKCTKKKTDDDEFVEQSDLQHLNERFFSEEDSNKISSKLNDTMIATCDFANHQVSKMINSYWLVDKASASEFRELGRVVDDFTSQCRNVCGRSSSSLHSAFTAQANKFVQTFHQARKGKLTLILNGECWKRVDVPTEFQVLVNGITQSGHFPLLKLTSHESKPLYVMTVNDEAYMVVGSVLILLKITTEYCVCASELVDMAPNVYRYLVELLQFFNARSCQLLLGANAVYTAGLKSITSRNLSLASRNLQFIVCLLPFIREHFQTTVRPNPKTSHCASGIKMFDLVKRDIEQHVVEIERKLKSIINSLIANQLRQWEASLPVPSKAFRNISKQIQKLHEAIGDILPPLQLQEIFRSAHDFFMVKLREQLKDMNVLSIKDSRSTAVTLDIKCYVNALSKLNMIPSHELNRTMEDIWVTI